MSNHYHLVLRVDKDTAESLSDDEVLERWTQLFSGPLLVRSYLDSSDGFNEAMLQKVSELAAVYRERLYDISWFMRVLNESIARMANKEDGVTGRFWEGRFKSQALLDEQAILSVMAYVDLNPVRAGMAEDLIGSDYTSAQRRIAGEPVSKAERTDVMSDADEPVPNKLKFEALEHLPLATLMPFDPAGRAACAVPFALQDYLEFVDYLGRAVHPDKRGFIPANKPVLMKALGLSEAWIEEVANGSWLKSFGWAIGTQDHLRQNYSGRIKGLNKARLLAA